MEEEKLLEKIHILILCHSMNDKGDGLGVTTMAREDAAVGFNAKNSKNSEIFASTPSAVKRYPLIMEELAVLMKRDVETRYPGVVVTAISGGAELSTIGELKKFFGFIPENVQVAIATPWWHALRIKVIIRRFFPKRGGYVQFIPVPGNPLTAKICLTEFLSWTLLMFPKSLREPARKLVLRMFFWRVE